MNKNYLFILIAVVAIILAVVLYSSMTATLSLDQIIKNKDCTALSKWEEEHIFDENLNVSSEQMSKAMKLAAECVGKALKNMGGNSDSSSDIIKARESLDRVLDFKSCNGFGMFVGSYIRNYDVNDLTEEEVNLINMFAKSCNFKKSPLIER